MTTDSVQRTATAQRLRGDLRAALAPGLLTIIAAAVQGDGAVITAAYRNGSPISDEQLSYPWAGATAISTSLIWGVTQVLIVIGLVAFARSGAAPTTAGRIGGRLAVAGAMLYVVGHALSLVAYDAALDDPISVAVLSSFGVGTLLTAVGLIMAGTATLRSGVWSGWRRFTPLVLGAWMVVMMPLQLTPALPVAVGVYAAATMALGLALVVEGLARESHP
jgi:hypothetical protein